MSFRKTSEPDSLVLQCRLCIRLILTVLFLTSTASAQEGTSLSKEVILLSEPAGAQVTYRWGTEGRTEQLGSADGRKGIVSILRGQEDIPLLFRFSLPQAFGDPVVQEKTVNWKELPPGGELPGSPIAFKLNILQKIRAGMVLNPFATLLQWLLLPLAVIAALVYRKTLRRKTEEFFAAEPPTDQISYGDYTVTGQLGKGAMGVVYLAEGRRGVKVALKSVLPELAQDPEFEKRFEHEIRACLKLKHPNLLRYFGHGVDSKGVPFSVTELLEGTTLKQKIAKGVEHPPRLASDVVEQIGSALHYLHTRGLVHRDIKPDNIFVCDDGTFKLMDLGIVKDETMTQMTKTGQILGTPAYMPPEQFDGQTVEASDQYSLGIILYEILTGRRPFVQPDVFALAFQHKSTKPEPPSTLEPRIPPDVEEAIQKMLAKRPQERFESMEEVRQTLSERLLYLDWTADSTETLHGQTILLPPGDS